jgi:SAM-dependent methyltransferase
MAASASFHTAFSCSALAVERPSGAWMTASGWSRSSKASRSPASPAASHRKTTDRRALFAEWAPHVVEAAGVRSGHTVLDVPCGTGVVAREAADRLGGQGRVVGLDINEGMLAVGRRMRPDIEWRLGDANALPFPDSSFEAVLCQASLMFFRIAPRRCARWRALLALRAASRYRCGAAWSPSRVTLRLSRSPLGTRAPKPSIFSALTGVLGDHDVAALFEAAGLEVTAANTRLGTARFDSIDTLVRTEVESTPLIERISADIYQRIIDDSRNALRVFATEGGEIEIPIEGHVIVARKSESN